MNQSFNFPIRLIVLIISICPFSIAHSQTSNVLSAIKSTQEAVKKDSAPDVKQTKSPDKNIPHKSTSDQSPKTVVTDVADKEKTSSNSLDDMNKAISQPVTGSKTSNDPSGAVSPTSSDSLQGMLEAVSTGKRKDNRPKTLEEREKEALDKLNHATGAGKETESVTDPGIVSPSGVDSVSEVKGKLGKGQVTTPEVQAPSLTENDRKALEHLINRVNGKDNKRKFAENFAALKSNLGNFLGEYEQVRIDAASYLYQKLYIEANIEKLSTKVMELDPGEIGGIVTNTNGLVKAIGHDLEKVVPGVGTLVSTVSLLAGIIKKSNDVDAAEFGQRGRFTLRNYLEDIRKYAKYSSAVAKEEFEIRKYLYEYFEKIADDKLLEESNTLNENLSVYVKSFYNPAINEPRKNSVRAEYIKQLADALHRFRYCWFRVHTNLDKTITQMVEAGTSNLRINDQTVFTLEPFDATVYPGPHIGFTAKPLDRFITESIVDLVNDLIRRDPGHPYSVFDFSSHVYLTLQFLVSVNTERGPSMDKPVVGVIGEANSVSRISYSSFTFHSAAETMSGDINFNHFHCEENLFEETEEFTKPLNLSMDFAMNETIRKTDYSLFLNAVGDKMLTATRLSFLQKFNTKN